MRTDPLVQPCCCAATLLLAPKRAVRDENGLLCVVLCCHPAGERLHVLDLDNDGLITEKELSDALVFLKANLDEQDLKALLQM